MQKAKVAEFVAFPGKGSDVEDNLLETKTQALKALLDSVLLFKSGDAQGI